MSAYCDECGARSVAERGSRRQVIRHQRTCSEFRATGWRAHNAKMREQAEERGSVGVLDAGRGYLLVPSRTVERRSYQVVVGAAGRYAKVSCNCPAGSSQPPLGSTPCHHGAVCCLQMESAGLLSWTGGEWFVSEEAQRRVQVELPAPRPVRNPCATCGAEVDPDCLVPIGQQEVRDGDAVRHRACA